MSYFINGTPQLKQIIAVCQINGKTVAIFFAVYTVRRPVPFLLVVDLLETFSKDCAKELKRRRRDHCFASQCDIF